MRPLIALLVIFLTQSCSTLEPFCEAVKPHPIDVQLDADLKKSGGVTVAIREAQSKAYDLWDKELNKSYKDLISALGPSDQELLKQSQRAWLTFRDAQTKLWWGERFYGNSGTLGPVAVSDLSRELLKQRTCEIIKFKKLVEHGQ